MEILIVVLIIGLIPAMIASSKGRSFILWYIYGMAIFIIALPHALLLKSAAQKAIEANALAGARGGADELEKFAALREKGLITEAEFEAKKRAILGA